MVVDVLSMMCVRRYAQDSNISQARAAPSRDAVNMPVREGKAVLDTCTLLLPLACNSQVEGAIASQSARAGSISFIRRLAMAVLAIPPLTCTLK